MEIKTKLNKFNEVKKRVPVKGHVMMCNELYFSAIKSFKGF